MDIQHSYYAVYIFGFVIICLYFWLVQWVALLPNSSKILGSILNLGYSLSGQSLYVA